MTERDVSVGRIPSGDVASLLDQLEREGRIRRARPRRPIGEVRPLEASTGDSARQISDDRGW